MNALAASELLQTILHQIYQTTLEHKRRCRFLDAMGIYGNLGEASIQMAEVAEPNLQSKQQRVDIFEELTI